MSTPSLGRGARLGAGLGGVAGGLLMLVVSVLYGGWFMTPVAVLCVVIGAAIVHQEWPSALPPCPREVGVGDPGHLPPQRPFPDYGDTGMNDLSERDHAVIAKWNAQFEQWWDDSSLKEWVSQKHLARAAFANGVGVGIDHVAAKLDKIKPPTV